MQIIITLDDKEGTKIQLTEPLNPASLVGILEFTKQIVMSGQGKVVEEPIEIEEEVTE